MVIYLLNNWAIMNENPFGKYNHKLVSVAYNCATCLRP